MPPIAAISASRTVMIGRALLLPEGSGFSTTTVFSVTGTCETTTRSEITVVVALFMTVVGTVLVTVL